MCNVSFCGNLATESDGIERKNIFYKFFYMCPLFIRYNVFDFIYTNHCDTRTRRSKIVHSYVRLYICVHFPLHESHSISLFSFRAYWDFLHCFYFHFLLYFGFHHRKNHYNHHHRHHYHWIPSIVRSGRMNCDGRAQAYILKQKENEKNIFSFGFRFESSLSISHSNNKIYPDWKAQ